MVKRARHLPPAGDDPPGDIRRLATSPPVRLLPQPGSPNAIADFDEARHAVNAYEMMRNGTTVVSTYMGETDRGTLSRRSGTGPSCSATRSLAYGPWPALRLRGLLDRHRIRPGTMAAQTRRPPPPSASSCSWSQARARMRPTSCARATQMPYSPCYASLNSCFSFRHGSPNGWCCPQACAWASRFSPRAGMRFGCSRPRCSS